MHFSFAQPSAVLSVIAFLFAFISSLFAICDTRIRKRRKRKVDKEHNKQSPYEDEDGVAKEVPSSRVSILLTKSALTGAAWLGLFIALSLSFYEHQILPGPRVQVLSNWLAFASWVPIVSLSCIMANQKNSIMRHTYGKICGFSAVLILVSTCTQLYALVIDHGRSISAPNFMSAALIAQTVCAAIVSVASLSFPRRPAIEYNGQDVDRQFTVSALSYWTLGWGMDILRRARSKENLDIDDLPMLHNRARSSYLLSRLQDEVQKRSLWKALAYVHWPDLAFQNAFACFSAITEFAPQLVMYALLKLLEQGIESKDDSVYASILVIGLGLAIIVAAWADTWTSWLGFSKVAVQVRSELSALVFAKATRRKDVKESKSKETVESGNVDNGSTNQPGAVANASVSSPTKRPDKEDDDVEKTRQGTINLVGVDSKRVSDFLKYHFLFIEVGTKFVVSIVFLVNLLGWSPVLIGFGVFLVAAPLNIWTSKRFTDAEDELMSVRDRKLLVVTEALQGIRQIKFSAQEDQWQDRIRGVRSTELKVQWKVFCYDTILIFCWLLGPILLSAIALAVYAIIHGTLSASVAFTSIAIFDSLEFTLAVLPEFIADGLEAWVSIKRLDEYLKAPERHDYKQKDKRVVFQDATIAWPSDTEGKPTQERFTLTNVNLSIPNGELTVISGMTGSGKSLLLAAIIGEADLLSGTVKAPQAPSVSERLDRKAGKNNWIIDSAIAYVAQIPWIENATVKENILFGLPFDKGRYDKVLDSCALRKDLEILDDGDKTDIGFNGINLSGGQRWRITLARALYSRAGILVLDDIFSAVDAQVGRQLFEEALTGELGHDRTRILVTHHTGLVMPKTNYFISLSDGTVKYAGSPESLEESEEIKNVTSADPGDTIKIDDEGISDTAVEDNDLHKVLTSASHKSKLIDSGGHFDINKSKPKKFVEDETKARGSIKLKMYLAYFSSSGGLWFWVPILVLFIGHQAVTIGRSYFVSIWTRSYETKEEQVHLMALLRPSRFQKVMTKTHDNNLTFYLGLYLGLSILQCFTGTLRYFTVYTRSIRASKKMFEEMTYTVLRAPLRWLDTVPLGRILNRFTADFDSIDSKLGTNLAFMIYEFLQVISVIVAAVFVSPLMLLVAFVLLIICGYITSWYLDGAREVKRLESVAKSPIFELFGALLAGVGTIRAFDKSQTFVERMFDKVDAHARALWHLWLINRWVALSLNAIGAVFATSVAAFVAFAGLDASLAGFALSFALEYSIVVVWATRFYAEVELSMNAVERVLEYTNLPIEDQGGKISPPAAWPAEGRLEVNDLEVGYAPNLPAVLKGLTFSVDRNERVGVVGRTGAGKSSLTLSLFRFLEARAGTITIDGINVADIPLKVLRSRLSIIPQDPVLFSGTVRSNLDPFNEHTDTELQDALERVHLSRSTNIPSRDEPADPSTSTGSAPAVESTANSNPTVTLSTPISESGLNLSQGQRQLLCLARAIVSRPKLLVLDEATSAVDMETDLLIQRSIREEFTDSTLLVIAHRLSTIADFDRILVMQEGRAVEYGRPRELMRDEGKVKRREDEGEDEGEGEGKGAGVFRSLVEESGEKDELRRVIEGRDE